MGGGGYWGRYWEVDDITNGLLTNIDLVLLIA